MYYVKATVRNLSSAALLSLLKVASDDFNEVAEEAKKCDRYFPKPLIKHFEVAFRSSLNPSCNRCWLRS